MDWLRLWHDMPTDPKWRVIALRAAASISEVIAVYTFVLVNASCNNMKRGETHGIVSEDIAAALGVAPEVVEKILAAMQGKVLNGNHVTGWDARQTRREVSSTSRVKAFRERRMKPNETHETRFTVSETHETTDKKRLDKSREEKPLSSGKGLSLVPSDWESVLTSAIDSTGKSIHARHPKPRRDVGEKAVAKFLIAILKRKKLHAESKVREAVEYLAALDARHDRLCSSPQWAKDGGEFAKGLNNWIGSPKEFFEQEPTEGAIRPRDGPNKKEQATLEFRQRMMDEMPGRMPELNA